MKTIVRTALVFLVCAPCFIPLLTRWHNLHSLLLSSETLLHILALLAVIISTCFIQELQTLVQHLIAELLSPRDASGVSLLPESIPNKASLISRIALHALMCSLTAMTYASTNYFGAMMTSSHMEWSVRSKDALFEIQCRILVSTLLNQFTIISLRHCLPKKLMTGPVFGSSGAAVAEKKMQRLEFGDLLLFVNEATSLGVAYHVVRYHSLLSATTPAAAAMLFNGPWNYWSRTAEHFGFLLICWLHASFFLNNSLTEGDEAQSLSCKEKTDNEEEKVSWIQHALVVRRAAITTLQFCCYCFVWVLLYCLVYNLAFKESNATYIAVGFVYLVALPPVANGILEFLIYLLETPLYIRFLVLILSLPSVVLVIFAAL